MENIPRLYNICLRKVSLFLTKGIWNSSGDTNPFSELPAKIADDLASTTLRIQKLVGFRAEHLKPLLTSGVLREFKIENLISPHGFQKVGGEIPQALRFLASGSQSLQVLQVTHGGRQKDSSELTNALQKLLRNSPKLKYIHSQVPFQLKILRRCKQLKSILLHFVPHEPWYDFLERDNGNEHNFHTFDSLETFTICIDKCIKLSEEVVSEYIVILLMHCPSLTSLGSLETSRALAQLRKRGLSLQLRLRHCQWKKGRWIRDAVTCYPLMEELFFCTRCIRSIEPLKNLRNLVSLHLYITVERDTTVYLDNLLKEIGHQLKDLNLVLLQSALDMSKLLKNCSNLESLEFYVLEHSYSEPAVRLPNLKRLILNGFDKATEQRFFRLLSGCHSLTELEITCHGFNDEILEEFLKKNSFKNLKIAYFEDCELTKRGFIKFLLNAPNLEKVNAITEDMELPDESVLKEALIETNHKAESTNYCVMQSDKGFHKNLECNVRWY